MSSFIWNSDLKLITHNIRDLQNIFFSPTSKPFKTPQGNTVDVQCYFCTIQQAKAKFVSYVIFLDPIRKITFFYEYKSNPYPANDLFKIEEEGLKFCSQQGFELDDPQIWMMDENKRVSWIQHQGIFDCSPRGEFSVRPSSTKDIADGKSMIKITSDLLPTSTGTPVPDGSKFWVKTNLGKIDSTEFDSAMDAWAVYSKDGMLKFQLQAPEIKGNCIVDIESADKQAHGSTTLYFQSGPPHGKIKLKCSTNFLLADNQSFADITSKSIKDAFGNPVDDGAEITVSTNMGKIIAEDSFYKDDKLIIPTKTGRINFRYVGGSKVGLAEISVAPLSTCQETHVKIVLIPGTPHGNFPINPEKTRIQADGKTMVKIEAGPITDRFGNQVADEQMMILQCSNGSILTSPENESGNVSHELPTKDGKIIFWFKASKVKGKSFIAVRNFDRTSTGTCSIELE